MSRGLRRGVGAVWEECGGEARAWREEHPQGPPLVVSVNISARQLARPDLADTVEGVLGRTGLEGNCLALDVTATVYLRAREPAGGGGAPAGAWPMPWGGC